VCQDRYVKTARDEGQMTTNQFSEEPFRFVSVYRSFVRLVWTEQKTGMLLLVLSKKDKQRFFSCFSCVTKEFLDSRLIAKSLRRKLLLELSPDFLVGNSQFMASFFPTVAENISSTRSGHSCSKTVSSNALYVAWLVCTFHETPNLYI
jgi:hypothetical protein